MCFMHLESMTQKHNNHPLSSNQSMLFLGEALLTLKFTQYLQLIFAPFKLSFKSTAMILAPS